MDKVNWAIVGFGKAGRKIYNFLSSREDSVVRGVCDIDKSKLIGVNSGTSYYTSLEELLDKDDYIDIIALCTPSYTHYELTKFIIDNGVKNVLIEKPPTMSLPQLIDLLNLSEKRHSNVFVVLQYRYNPYILSLKDLMVNKELGDVIFSRLLINWPRDKNYYLKSPWRGRKYLEGGMIFNQLFHHIDILIQLFGFPENIFFYGRKRKYLFIETNDTVVIVLDFGSKGIASLLATVVGIPEEEIEEFQIITDRYNILFRGKRLMYGISLPPKIIITDEIKSKNPDFVLYNKLFDDIYNDMRGKGTALVRLRTLIKTVKVAEVLWRKENENNRS